MNTNFKPEYGYVSFHEKELNIIKSLTKYPKSTIPVFLAMIKLARLSSARENKCTLENLVKETGLHAASIRKARENLLEARLIRSTGKIVNVESYYPTWLQSNYNFGLTKVSKAFMEARAGQPYIRVNLSSFTALYAALSECEHSFNVLAEIALQRSKLMRTAPITVEELSKTVGQSETIIRKALSVLKYTKIEGTTIMTTKKCKKDAKDQSRYEISAEVVKRKTEEEFEEEFEEEHKSVKTTIVKTTNEVEAHLNKALKLIKYLQRDQKIKGHVFVRPDEEEEAFKAAALQQQINELQIK